MPKNVSTTQPPPPVLEEKRSGGGGSGDGGSGGGQHPFIQGLIQTLPKPDGPWPLDKRAQWLQAALSMFNLIYKDDADSKARIEIKVNDL